jgi:hypothetical protein
VQTDWFMAVPVKIEGHKTNTGINVSFFCFIKYKLNCIFIETIVSVRLNHYFKEFSCNVKWFVMMIWENEKNIVSKKYGSRLRNTESIKWCQSEWPA